jgi:hypothetical protein
LFNKGQFWERTQAGDLTIRLLADRHPSKPLAKEPFCTRSQIVAYYDDTGKRVAEVHQYLRKDGSLGAGGKPDPKRVWTGGKLYVLLDP